MSKISLNGLIAAPADVDAFTSDNANLMVEDEVIQPAHLPQGQSPPAPPPTSDPTPAKNLGLFEAVDTYEKELICRALQTTLGNRNQAAKLLRVSERALAYKLRKHEIDHTIFRAS